MVQTQESVWAAARTRNLLEEVAQERIRQDEKFPGQWPRIDDFERLAILSEEYAEALTEKFLGVARSVNDKTKANLRAELVQVAAVAVAWAEQL